MDCTARLVLQEHLLVSQYIMFIIFEHLCSTNVSFNNFFMFLIPCRENVVMTDPWDLQENLDQMLSYHLILSKGLLVKGVR